MSLIEKKERKSGALMDAFIGDALGLGPHWYYDLDELRRDYGEWISGYTKPKKGRYHDRCDAGDLSQAGYILEMLSRSILDEGGYDHERFCQALDEDLFPLLDGRAESGPGGYTSQSIRDAWKRRVKEGRPWTETGGNADTTEAIERALALAIRYADSPDEMARNVVANSALTQTDDTILSLTLAFCSVLALLIQGDPLDGDISSKLMAQVKDGRLPFHAVTLGDESLSKSGKEARDPLVKFASPDPLLSPSYMARAATDPGIRIEPAWKVSIVYGMPCAAYHILPASYYLAARFPDDFEAAVLHAVNGGGQNQARAILTGALTGAQTGLSGIPRHLIDGLKQRDELLELASRLAEA